jgi:hypothetical protein
MKFTVVFAALLVVLGVASMQGVWAPLLAVPVLGLVGILIFWVVAARRELRGRGFARPPAPRRVSAGLCPACGAHHEAPDPGEPPLAFCYECGEALTKEPPPPEATKPKGK